MLGWVFFPRTGVLGGPTGRCWVVFGLGRFGVLWGLKQALLVVSTEIYGTSSCKPKSNAQWRLRVLGAILEKGQRGTSLL